MPRDRSGSNRSGHKSTSSTGSTFGHRARKSSSATNNGEAASSVRATESIASASTAGLPRTRKVKTVPRESLCNIMLDVLVLIPRFCSSLRQARPTFTTNITSRPAFLSNNSRSSYSRIIYYLTRTHSNQLFRRPYSPAKPLWRFD